MRSRSRSKRREIGQAAHACDHALDLFVSVERSLNYSRHVLQEGIVRVSKILQGTPGAVKGGLGGRGKEAI